MSVERILDEYLMLLYPIESIRSICRDKADMQYMTLSVTKRHCDYSKPETNKNFTSKNVFL